MSTQINTTSAATTESSLRPTSYDQVDLINTWVDTIRTNLNADTGETIDNFGGAMKQYGVYLQRIPAGIISTGYVLGNDGQPKLFSGSYSFYVEIDNGMSGLSGVIDYRTGMHIQHQSFIQVFVPAKDKEYADSLIEQGMVSNLLVRPNLNSTVVRFELVNHTSALCKQMMERDGVSKRSQVAVVLPVESKGSDLSYEDASNIKRAISREDNGTSAYNKGSKVGMLRSWFGA